MQTHAKLFQHAFGTQFNKSVILILVCHILMKLIAPVEPNVSGTQLHLNVLMTRVVCLVLALVLMM